MAERGRPRKVTSLPPGFTFGQRVRIYSTELRKPQIGRISHACKYDGGIQVQLEKTALEGVAEYVCVQTERGDKIESVRERKKSYTRSTA